MQTETPITYDQWSRFETGHPAAISTYHSRHEDGDPDSMSRLAEAYEAFTAAKRRPTRTETTSVDTDPDPRWDALAEILVFRARQDPDVIGFRRDVLDDKLVDPDRVAEWIKTTAGTDGKPTQWVTVPRRDDGTWPASQDEAIALGSFTRTRELIAYTVPGDTSTHYQPVRFRGRLWHLRTVARRITQGAGWPEAWTTTFILTDLPPPRPMVFGYRIHESSVGLPTMNQIGLTVNPYAVGPRRLETAYRKIRSDELGISRVDAISEKTAALAVHWEKTEGQTTSDRRAAWNRLHPEWKYPDPTGNFGRDGRAAHRQVTGEEGTAQ